MTIRIVSGESYRKRLADRAFNWWPNDVLGRKLHKHGLPVLMVFGPMIERRFDEIMQDAWESRRDRPILAWDIKEGVLLPPEKRHYLEKLRKTLGTAHVDPRLADFTSSVQQTDEGYLFRTKTGLKLSVSPTAVTTTLFDDRAPIGRVFGRSDAAAMVQVAIAQGWSAIHIECGDPKIRDLIWLEAKRAGIEVVGVVPGPHAREIWRREVHARRVRELEIALDHLEGAGSRPEARDPARLASLVRDIANDDTIMDIVKEFKPKLAERIHRLLAKLEREAGAEAEREAARARASAEGKSPDDPFANLARQGASPAPTPTPGGP